MSNMIYDKYAEMRRNGSTLGDIERAKRAGETPEQTKRRHQREADEAAFEGEENERQRRLDGLRRGWTEFSKPTLETDIYWSEPYESTAGKVKVGGGTSHCLSLYA